VQDSTRAAEADSDNAAECVAEEFEIVPIDGDDALAAFASRL
jgi:hypothetical protein